MAYLLQESAPERREFEIFYIRSDDDPDIAAGLGISFFTSFFRLAFNKRFFDNAKKGSLYHYLFIKSYYSRLFLALGFGLAGVWITVAGAGANMVLEVSYWAGVMFAGLYFFYRPAENP